VDYQKVDPALAAALSKQPPAPRGPAALVPPEPKLSVFVHVDPDVSPAQHAKLTRMGLPKGAFQGGIATASLSADQVRKLAEQPFVRRIQLSSRLDLLRDDLS